MSFGTAMQRTMPTSTSYQTSVSCVPVSRQWQSYRRSTPTPGICSASRQQGCGPRGGFGGFGPMMFGDNAAAASQAAELMQNFAKAMNTGAGEKTQLAGFLPVDVTEQDSKYLLIADVPGLEKADLKISINQTEQTLKIAGERKRAQNSTKGDDSSNSSQYRMRYERGMGRFQRVVSDLPKDADLTAVSAKVDKGVLTITVQKKDLARDDQDVRIDIN